jgi:hypothetical protein
MEDISSKMSLGEFLRSRRERLTPEEVGLASYGRIEDWESGARVLIMKIMIYTASADTAARLHRLLDTLEH